MKIYIASSWKNPLYHSTMGFLKLADFEILDWQDTEKGGGFSWSQASDIPLNKMTGLDYRDIVLKSERAKRGFEFDFSCMKNADVCVLLLPCGRSAHLEAGWFVGSGKPLIIYIPTFDGPDLMYKLATDIVLSLEELLTALQRL